eukprot:scaffold7707_cov417-Prasinococcus_capsulatus_cf.AAC.1
MQAIGSLLHFYLVGDPKLRSPQAATSAYRRNAKSGTSDGGRPRPKLSHIPYAAANASSAHGKANGRATSSSKRQPFRFRGVVFDVGSLWLLSSDPAFARYNSCT